MIKQIPTFILKRDNEKILSGSFFASTMFIDISGFTAMTHKLMRNGKEGAEILSNIINDIFSPAIEIIYGNGGFISTFAGDAFTAIFPTETVSSDLCYYSAVLIRNLFIENQTQSTKFGNFDLSVNIGISSGNVEWGIVKSSSMKSYYFKGNTINNCAKNQAYAGKNEIISDSFKFNKNIYKIEKFNKNLFLIKDVKENKSKIKNKFVADNSQKMFLPPQLFDSNLTGEFRDIVSCFISFKEEKESLNNISEILNLCISYGGYFNKIDFGDKGANILVLFGAPTAKENIFKRASDFAMEIQNIENFTSRIGLTFGTVFTGFIGSKIRNEYTALGMVVNLSARFMMKANWNEIFVDRYFNRRLNFSYDIEEKNAELFKGFKEKIPVFVLKGKKQYKNKFSGKLVGRKKEISEIDKSCQPIFQNKFGGFINIRGGAGIGKSRLIDEFRNLEIKKHKVNWFYCPCDEILRSSFNPFKKFLANFFNQSPQNYDFENRENFENKLNSLINETKDEQLKKELLTSKESLAVMIGIFYKDSIFSKLSPKSKFNNKIYAIKNLIKVASLTEPVIIEIEDVHWIDDDSKTLLKMLSSNVKEYPFLIITSSRNNDDGSKFELELENVAQKDIVLENFGKTSTKEFIKEILERTISEDTFEFVWEKSEGNPFFIEQIILFLLENNFLDENADIITDKINIPNSINSIIISRVDRLNSNLKNIIKTASVLGREFFVNVLSSMLEREDIRYELQSGENENIWNSISELKYIFKHSLIRECVYEMQLKNKLRQLHQLAAEVIISLNKDNLRNYYEEIAHHYFLAENNKKAIEYLEKSGNKNKEEYSNFRAIDNFSKLINLLNAKILTCPKQSPIFLKYSKILCHTYIKLGQIYDHLGNREQAYSNFLKSSDLSQKNNFKNLIALSLLNLGEHYNLIGNNIEALKYYRQSREIFESINDSSGIGRSDLAISGILILLRDLDEALDLLQKALNYFEQNEDFKNMANCYGKIGIVNLQLNQFDYAQKYLTKQYNLSKKIGDKFGQLQAIGNIGIIKYFSDKSEEAIKCYEEKIALAEQIGDKYGIELTLGNIGLVYQQMNNMEKFYEYNQKKLIYATEIRDIIGIGISLGNIANYHLIKGNFPTAIDNLQKSIKYFTKANDQKMICLNQYYIGETYRQSGNFVQALKYYQLTSDTAIKYELYDLLLDAAIGKMDIYYQQKDFSKILEISNKYSKESKTADHNIFQAQSKLFKLLIEFHNAENEIDKNIKLNSLVKFLDESQELEIIGKASAELYNFYKYEKNISKAEKYKEKAIKAYKSLFENTSENKYKIILDSLSTN